MCPTLLIAIVVSAVLSAQIRAPRDEFDAFAKDGDTLTMGGGSADKGLWSISIGTVGDRLVFVVFAASPRGKEHTSPVISRSSWTTRPDGTPARTSVGATLNISKGGSIPLPIRSQLIEVTGDNIRCSDRRVTLAEIKAYWNSRPDLCSIEDLVRFVDEYRKKAGK